MSVMTDIPDSPLPSARPRVNSSLGRQIILWLRANLFATIPNTVITLLILLVIGKGLVSLVQWGLLNAVFSLPNIALALVGGILIDRFGPSRVALWTAGLCCVGTVLTAIGLPFGLMVLGRLLFGVGEETLLIALLAGLAQWFAAELFVKGNGGLIVGKYPDERRVQTRL